jgi:hypothetical protein
LTAAMSGEDDLHGVAERRLRRVDQRYTSGRRAIIELLVNAGHPVSIGDIADRLPGLPRSSAYRHLTDLQAAQVPGWSGGSPRATSSAGSSSPRTSPSITITCCASAAARSPT